MTGRVWRLRSANIDEVIHAADQFEAWQTLRDRPLKDFGLVVSAEPDEDADPIFVRTSGLMFWWGRDEEAARFITLAEEVGLPDTTIADQEFGRTRRAAR